MRVARRNSYGEVRAFVPKHPVSSLALDPARSDAAAPPNGAGRHETREAAVRTMSPSPVPTLGETEIASLFRELARDARAFRFEVAPNPCVGAAVLARGRVIARGFHEVWGGPHAEVNALRAAALTDVPPDEWDTLVCTLEPCSSTGKTPPCVELLRASPIPRILVGELDPDRRHQGSGLRLLQESGKKVELWEGFAPLKDLAPQFLAWNEVDRLRRPRPWTIAKWAQTRTGQLVPPQGVGGGRWISGPEALREVQTLRGRVDAIVTGVGTILDDDPRFTVRPPWYGTGLARALWLLLLMVVYGTVVLTFATHIANTGAQLASWAVASGMGADHVRQELIMRPPVLLSDPTSFAASTPNTMAGSALSFWLQVFAWLLEGFAISFFWTAATIIYFLLRLSLDAKPLDQIFMPAAQPNGQTLPLVGIPAAEQREAEQQAPAGGAETTGVP